MALSLQTFKPEGFQPVGYGLQALKPSGFKPVGYGPQALKPVGYGPSSLEFLQPSSP